MKAQRSSGVPRRLAIAAILALLLVAAALAPALAHAIIVHSDPADNAQVAAAPAEVRIWFSEPIDERFSQARVIDGYGKVVATPPVHTAPDDQAEMVLALPKLGDGVYTVAWVNLSAADGHSDEGHLAFRVGTGAGSSPGLPLDTVRPLEVALRWLSFAGLAGLVGALAVALVVLRPNGSWGAGEVGDALAAARRRTLAWAACCALASALLGVAMLAWQASSLSFGAAGSPVGLVLRLLGDTRWGQLWIDRELMLLAMAELSLFAYRRPRDAQPAPNIDWLELVLAVLALAVLTTQALAGHAAAVATAPALSVIMDVIHLGAASVWVGGLAALAVALLPLVLRSRGTIKYTALVQAGWRPFGAVAAVSVGAVIATGLYNTGQEVASPDAIIGTFYGRALIGKILLVLLVGGCGLLNSSLLHPRLAALLARLLRRRRGWTPVPLSSLPGLVIAELLVGGLVLLATGLLTSSPSAQGPEFAPPPAAGVSGAPIAQQADDVQVTFEAQPNTPGHNLITITASGTRQPPAPILRVIVHFTNTQQGIGAATVDAQEVSPGVYRIDGSQLSLAGPWQIDLAVRRKGIEDSYAHFDWVVGTPARPVQLSNQPLEPALTLAGLALLAVTLLSALAGAVRARLASATCEPRQPMGGPTDLDRTHRAG